MEYKIGDVYKYTRPNYSQTPNECVVDYVGRDGRPVLWDGESTWIYDDEICEFGSEESGWEFIYPNFGA